MGPVEWAARTARQLRYRKGRLYHEASKQSANPEGTPPHGAHRLGGHMEQGRGDWKDVFFLPVIRPSRYRLRLLRAAPAAARPFGFHFDRDVIDAETRLKARLDRLRDLLRPRNVGDARVQRHHGPVLRQRPG